jgi:acyl-coenzyme A thioesterase PaaI-like protein
MNALIEAIPYARFLGARLEKTANGFECVLPFRQELIGNPVLPAIHGGVLGAFLELTAILRLLDESSGDRVPKPINFSVDYLRTAGPRDTRARADIFKLGRRIANVHVVAWQEDPDRLVVAGNGKFLF